LLEIQISTMSGMKPLISFISLLANECSSVGGGLMPFKSLIFGIFETIGSDEHFPAFKDMLGHWIMNTTTAMEMFEIFV
jgi:hypothetical protein